MARGSSLRFGILGLSCVALTPHQALPQTPAIQVTLLGTGSPPPSLERFGPCILVEAGGTAFLIDAGRGATQRLAQIHTPFAAITGVLLTHLHSDHVVGLPDLWLTGWLIGYRAAPLRLWGPTGTQDMAHHLEAAFAVDVQVRSADNQAPSSGGRFEARDITEGTVFDSGGVVVTAFSVDHGSVRPALGYRLDYHGHAVVFSGDTRLSPNLIAHAQHVDVLIHEVAAATPADLAASPLSRGILAIHTTPAEAAEVFTRTQPKLAVYSHLVLRPGVTAEQLVALTRPRYAGPLVVGSDLMRIAIADSVLVTSAHP